MNFVNNEKGTVTIYLLIVFMAMLLFIGSFIDLARIRVAQNQLRRIANASARSVLANYNAALKNEYGLFAVNQSDFNKEFQKYVLGNLSTSVGQNFNLFDYKYEETTLVLNQPLRDINSLRRQILEDMKYTAPLEISRDLIDKFKAVGNMASAFGDQDQGRKTVKGINNKIRDISKINETIKNKCNQIKNDKKSLKSITDRIETIDSKKSKSKADLYELKKLEKSRSAMVEKIAKNKKAIQVEIEASKKKRNEIQEEINRFSSDGKGPQNTDGGDQIIKNIRENMNEVKRENVETLKGNLVQIQSNIEQAVAALNLISADEEIQEDLFSRINIDSADEICTRLRTSSLVPGQQDLERNLTVLQGVYRDKFITNPLFQGYSAEPEALGGTIDSFGEDNSDQEADEKKEALDRIFNILNVEEKLGNMRNELYINEYALTHFSHLTGDPKGDAGYDRRNTEVEYILYGGSNPKGRAVGELYATRFALDTLAYFIFSKPPAPAELLSRTVYSLIMGALQASVDTYKLLADGANTVVVAEMSPANPLEEFNLTLNYKDHLRLFMLLKSDEEGKLKRMVELISRRSNIDVAKAYTLSDGSVEVSLKMWFLPLAGFDNIGNGPFGTRIKDGRCYISKNVEFGY
ncbi:MAG: pilus assembly protein TadG-related protein [Eubacteriales bacterium]